MLAYDVTVTKSFSEMVPLSLIDPAYFAGKALQLNFMPVLGNVVQSAGLTLNSLVVARADITGATGLTEFSSLIGRQVGITAGAGAGQRRMIAEVQDVPNHPELVRLVTSTASALDLGQLGAIQSYTLEAPASVNLFGTVIEHFRFGLDLDPGKKPEDAFFLQAAAGANGIASKAVTIDAHIQAGVANKAPLHLNLRVGFLGDVDSTATIDYAFAPSIALAKLEADPLGRVTLDDLQTTTLAALVDTHVPPATLSGRIGSSVTLGSWTATDQGLLLGLRNGDFSALKFTVDPADDHDDRTGYDEILNFVNADTAALLQYLDAMGSQLQNFVDAINTPVPFTSAGVKVIAHGTIQAGGDEHEEGRRERGFPGPGGLLHRRPDPRDDRGRQPVE